MKDISEVSCRRIVNEEMSLKKETAWQARKRQFFEFCDETSMHGFADWKRSRLMRMFWLVIICVFFVIAGSQVLKLLSILIQSCALLDSLDLFDVDNRMFFRFTPCFPGMQRNHFRPKHLPF